MTAVYPLDIAIATNASAPMPDNEPDRLHALHSLRLLDSQPNDRFDAITSLAADFFSTPIALISLIDSDRQWFLSKYGLDVPQTSRNVAFCSYAIHEEEIFVVEDAMAHPVFANNPLVVDEPHIRFYAGAVVRDVSGLALGTLCVIDRKPRTFDAVDRRRLISLCHLARSEMVMSQAAHRQRVRAQLSTQRDPVTDAYWGEAFYAATYKRGLAHSGGRQIVVAVTFDNLDFLTDTLSRAVTDEVLLEVSQRVSGTCDRFGHTTLGRLDGKRLIARVEIGHANQTTITSSECKQQLEEALAAPVLTSSGVVKPRLTLAVSEQRDGTVSVRELVKLCRIAADQIPDDAALRSVVVDEAISQGAEKLFQIAADLAAAIETDSLRQVFQPKIDVGTRRPVGAECLLRWTHPELGAIAPPDIVAAADEAHLLFELDKWVIRSAIRVGERLQVHGSLSGRLSININGCTLVEPSFIGWLDNVLREEHARGRHYDFEIVETSLFSDFDDIVAAMHRVRALGVTFSLDDFGTGYSALSYLRELPIDHLKIDKAFVDDIVDQPKAAALCAGILTLADKLEITSIAEGVETKEQYNLLHQLKCHQIQGYYFSKPLEAEAFRTYLARYCLPNAASTVAPAEKQKP